METLVRGIYENQTLRLETPLPVKEGEVVEVLLTMPKLEDAAPRKRFSWEDGPILEGDGTNRLSDELRRQRDGE